MLYKSRLSFFREIIKSRLSKRSCSIIKISTTKFHWSISLLVYLIIS